MTRLPLHGLALSGLAILLSASAPRTAVAQATPPLTVTAENTLGFTRTDETVAIAWGTVTSRLAGACPDRVRVLDGASHREVVSQVVDNDGDGTPDELIFQSTFAPGEIRTFAVEAVSPAAPPAKARVFATHITDRDDIAWESDRIAYRMYGVGLAKIDSLGGNGVDVWVKRTRDPIVAKWYAKGHDLYHRDTGEGADFFDVGPTLGAGGTAIWRDETMYRPANFNAWRIIANGPVRAVFELKYAPWNAGGRTFSETKRVSIDAGQNLNRATSVFHAADGGDVPYVVGLVKRKGMIGSESRAQPWTWITGWGAVNPKDGGHGDLGTAVVLERSRLVDWKETETHYLAVAHARSGEPVVNYVGAGWTDSGDFRDVRDWWSYLEQLSLRLDTPLKVSLSPTAG